MLSLLSTVAETLPSTFNMVKVAPAAYAPTFACPASSENVRFATAVRETWLA